MQHGTYLILNIDETISSDGYIQTMKLLKNPGSLVSSETKVNSKSNKITNDEKAKAEELAKKAQTIWKTITGTPSNNTGNTYKNLFDLTPSEVKNKYSEMFSAGNTNTNFGNIPTYQDMVKNNFKLYNQK